MMLKKLKNYWDNANREIVVNKQELVLGIAACTLGGILLGILFSPKKSVIIGSYNSGNSGVVTANSQEEDAAEEDAAAQETSEAAQEEA